MMILLSILIPVIAGTILIIMPEVGVFAKRSVCFGYSLGFMALGAAAAGAVIVSEGAELVLCELTKNLPICFRVDDIGRTFASIVTIVWFLCLIFSWEYMKHEHKNKRYFGFYLVVYGILMGLDFAGNLVTFYAIFEMMTILSMPLVLHGQSREAILAGLKYMLYSFAGAYMVLFGFFFVCHYAESLSFVPGGVFAETVLAEHQQLLLLCAFLMILGFSVKAGMFPMHAWLPTAHPVAPAPASAALSGIIVKSGVIGIIRVVFFLFGADFLRGTWVQYTWMTLALLTVFMGSMLAYRTDILKKRLAYSTVSQLSYILFGLAVLNPMAVTGSLLHVIFHAFSKALLFLGAGAIIYRTQCHRASELVGIGKKMPVTVWCFAFASLALIGIPPTGGFLSKWYLAVGALRSEIPGFFLAGPVILLISALLTAGYLLPVVVKGFLPGEQYDYGRHQNLERGASMWWMLAPMMILAVLTIVPSIFSEPLLRFLGRLVETFV